MDSKLCLYLGKRSTDSSKIKTVNTANKSGQPKSQLYSQDFKPKSDVEADSELNKIMDAQMDKFETDKQWSEQWMINYEGYQPIEEPNLPLPPPKTLKTLQCRYCPKLFAKSNKRKCHEIVHSDKRPFSKF